MKNILYLCLSMTIYSTIYSDNKIIESVTIAILAKDKAHTLPLYLKCLEQQTWPKSKTNLYIRTNNNNDDTKSILRQWLSENIHKYAIVYFDDSDLTTTTDHKQHEWDGHRCKILAKIRQLSIEWAYQQESHYFVVDCDNFIKPNTIETMVCSNLPIVAPYLRLNHNSYYSNYHFSVDKNGYLAHDDQYYTLWSQAVKGLIQVPVVHCTYFIQYQYLPYMLYDDESYRYEYVIFSDNARKKNIPQYLDNRDIYGFVTFATTEEELMATLPAEILGWSN